MRNARKTFFENILREGIWPGKCFLSVLFSFFCQCPLPLLFSLEFPLDGLSRGRHHVWADDDDEGGRRGRSAKQKKVYQGDGGKKRVMPPLGRSVGRSSLKNALGGGEGGGERNVAKSVQEGFLPPSPNGLPDAVAPAEKKGRRDNPIISSAIWEERGWLELGREGGEKILTKRKIVPRRWRKILFFFFLYCTVFCSHFHGLFVSDFFLCTTHTRKRDDAKVRFSLF